MLTIPFCDLVKVTNIYLHYLIKLAKLKSNPIYVYILSLKRQAKKTNLLFQLLICGGGGGGGGLSYRDKRLDCPAVLV